MLNIIQSFLNDAWLKQHLHLLIIINKTTNFRSFKMQFFKIAIQKFKCKFIFSSKYQYLQMSYCEKLNHLIFPHNFQKVNRRAITTSSHSFYTVFRIVMFFLYALNFSYCAYSFRKKDVLFLTTWGLFLVVISGFVLLIQNLLYWCFQRCRLANFWKVSHFLFTITLIFEMFITGAYWGGIFPYFILNSSGKLKVYDILNSMMAHGIPLILLMFDLQFNMVVIWNNIYLIFYVLILSAYLIMNCIYTINVGVIYSVITYKSWLTYIFLLCCVLLLVACHFVARLFCKCCKQQRVLNILDQTQKKVDFCVDVALPKGSQTADTIPNKNQLEMYVV